jgi:2-C-methyl-D-erythritol 4-phosphate cytidylyltransferase/2-C-methyl-D-erythritol 2,4-cyclodiphosphate synthase
VRLALEAISPCATVLIHDGARPFVTAELVRAVLHSAQQTGAAVPAIMSADTIKQAALTGERSVITAHLKRADLRAVQTPQGFAYAPLLEAHQKARQEGKTYTDDSEIWHDYVGPVAVVDGSPANRKITTPEDFSASRLPRVGIGWDRHRLASGRRLLLGGVAIPSEKGEDGHSDGDVLAHAVMDALLGAAGLGDIGERFPPGDPQWKDADSMDLLRDVRRDVRAAGWTVGNLDCVVILESPRVLPHRQAIRQSLGEALGVPPERVFLKGKTGEGLGAVGRGEAVEALATVLVVPV